MLVGHLRLLGANPKLQPFFGCAVRCEPSSGRADNCCAVTTLVADIDFKRHGEEAAVDALASHPVAPSITVATGNGLHAYWLLSEPCFDTERAGRLLVSWGATVPLSDAVFDLPRVLRLPATLNHKYDPPRLTQVEVFAPDLRYEIEMLEGVAGEYADKVAPQPTPLFSGKPFGELPVRFDEGNRHAGLFRLVRSVTAKYGLSYEELLPLVQAVNDARCDPPLPAHSLRAFVRRAYDTPHDPRFAQ